MAGNREYEGKDLEEALHQAAADLKIAEPDLDYRIVEQGRPGLFGLGAKNVRIRVMPPIDSDAIPVVESGSVQSTPATPERTKTADELEGTVQQMLDLMGLKVEARAKSVDGSLSLELDGPDREALSEKKGELLLALQFLLNRMARRAWPKAGRINLYCNGRPESRDGELTELARRTAEEVARTGRTKRLRPMNSYERRLIHLTIRPMEGVGSRSEGDGYVKRVRVFKQKGRGRRR